MYKTINYGKLLKSSIMIPRDNISCFNIIQQGSYIRNYEKSCAYFTFFQHIALYVR